MVLRDIKKQHDEVRLLQQQKKSAREAIKGLSQQQDQQKALSKKLAKARMDLDLLLIDEKHVCCATPCLAYLHVSVSACSHMA